MTTTTLATVHEIKELAASLARRYHAMLPSLPADHGHCHEVAEIAAALAPEIGLSGVLCAGYLRLGDGRVTYHEWFAIDGDQVLHSPEPGLVELVPDDDRFEPDGHVPLPAVVKVTGSC